MPAPSWRKSGQARPHRGLAPAASRSDTSSSSSMPATGPVSMTRIRQVVLGSPSVSLHPSVFRGSLPCTATYSFVWQRRKINGIHRLHFPPLVPLHGPGSLPRANPKRHVPSTTSGYPFLPPKTLHGPNNGIYPKRQIEGFEGMSTPLSSLNMF